MCTSYYIGGSAEFASMIKEIRESSLTGFLEMTYKTSVCEDEDVFPGALAPVIARNKSGERRPFAMLFGFVLSGQKNKKILNARLETAAERPLFKDAWQSRRCIVPATYYYEWEHPSGQKAIRYAIRPSTSDAVYLCGLYRVENGVPQFVILTREAEPEIAFIHDRMPVMIPKSRIDDWIDPAQKPEDVLLDLLKTMEFEPNENCR